MMILLTAVLLLLTPGPDPVWTDDPFPEDSVSAEIERRLDRARGGDEVLHVADDPLHTAATIDSFYRDREFRPAWSTPDGLLPQADSLIAHVRRADREGLTPSDYHGRLLDSLTTAVDDYGARARRLPLPLRTSVDLVLTDVFFLYGVHMLQGRVQSSTIEPEWTARPRSADLVAHLNRALLTGNVGRSLRALAPPQVAYGELRAAYNRYRSLAARGGWPRLPSGPALRPDSTDSRVPVLRTRLRATGDLHAAYAGDSAAAPSDSLARLRYDSTLVAAVQHFQQRHGLQADGIVGSGTVEALNVTAGERAQQLRLALERWRWLPETLGNRHVRVNIAGFSLQYVDDGQEVLSMPVVTGRPFRQTPVFSDRIRYLVFNPYWHVPLTLAVEDKLPEIRRDLGYLDQQQMSVFDRQGQPVAPETVPWDSLSKDNFPYRLRQEPGPYNALGRVKFMFPNEHDVYLHDTPTRGDFRRERRAFSSGCIRLSRPFELAAALLADREGWDRERIDAVLESGEPRTVWLKTPTPVHILYWTAWAKPDGTVHFREDVYDRDPALADAMREGPPVLAGW